jgi:hypothetical protein
MPTLGLNLKVSGYRIQSTASKREFKLILREIVDLIGMTPAGKAATWKFPWYSQFWRRAAAWIIGRKHLPGLGGVGWTILQPLVEGFAVVDCWHDHGHWFLVIGSCRPYETRQVANFLRDNCGETEVSGRVRIVMGGL